MISVEPTKLDLNAQYICLGRICLHLTLLIRYFMLTVEFWGIPRIRWLTILLSYPSCSLNRPLNWIHLISLDEKRG